MADAQKRQGNGAQAPQDADLGELVQHISGDLKALARDEMELARLELSEGMQRPMADAGAIVLGGVLVLIGLGMLCTTAVVALAPLVPALWLRMLIMSALYFALGAGVAGAYVKRLRHDAPLQLRRTTREAARTAESLKREAKRG